MFSKVAHNVLVMFAANLGALMIIGGAGGFLGVRVFGSKGPVRLLKEWRQGEVISIILLFSGLTLLLTAAFS